MKTVFIGGGNMAYAIIKGLIKSGTESQSLHVIEINDTARQALDDLGIPNSESWPAGLSAQTVVMAVKPQVMQAVIEENRAHFEDCLLISIAAGVNTQQLQNWSGLERIARAMPNTPALVSKGMTGIFFTDACSINEKTFVEMLFNACGQVVLVDKEDQINAITAISGSGPGYVFFLMNSLKKAALEQGFSDEQAARLVEQTFLGAATLASESTDSFLTLQNKVTSKGGTTFAGLEALREGQVEEAIAEAANAARRRASELEKGQN